MFDHLFSHSSKGLDVGARRHDTADVNHFPPEKGSARLVNAALLVLR